MRDLVVWSPSGETLLARFRFVDGAVIAEYAAAATREQIERDGIVDHVGDGSSRLRPSDGAPFWEALPRAFVNSTFVSVRERSDGA